MWPHMEELYTKIDRQMSANFKIDHVSLDGWCVGLNKHIEGYFDFYKPLVAVPWHPKVSTG